MKKTKSGRKVLTTDVPEALEERPEGVPHKSLLKLLAAAGYSAVEISFDGGGDSGQVDGVVAFQPGGTSPCELSEEYASAITDWAYEVLGDYCPGDWVNNEGGYGVLRVEFGDTTNIVLNYSQRVTTTEDHAVSIDAFEVEDIVERHQEQRKKEQQRWEKERALKLK